MYICILFQAHTQICGFIPTYLCVCTYVHACMLMCMCICGGGGLVTKSCLTLVSPQTVACKAPLSMGFLRQEYSVGYHFLLQGIS